MRHLIVFSLVFLAGISSTRAQDLASWRGALSSVEVEAINLKDCDSVQVKFLVTDHTAALVQGISIQKDGGRPVLYALSGTVAYNDFDFFTTVRLCPITLAREVVGFEVKALYKKGYAPSLAVVIRPN